MAEASSAVDRGQAALDAVVDPFQRREPGTVVRPIPRALRHDKRLPTAIAEALPGFPVSAIWEGYTAPAYLVKHILAPGDLTVIFGQSGHFKSVVAVDLAMSVGSGRGYHGHRVRRAGVLYVVGEGHGGIRKRVRAWLIKHGFDASSEQPSVYFTSASADLLDRPDELRATVEAAEKLLGIAIEMVVIDTLAANFGAGDENHVRDMQLAIHGARQAAPKAAVLLVHHTGHGQEERERGSYALIAAADVRLLATYDESAKVIELRWKKLKDDERPEPLVFAWQKIDLEWTDEDGEELSSVVLDLLEGVSLPQGPRLVGLGKNQDTALRLLKTLLAKARRNLVDAGRNPAEACILIDGWRRALEQKGIHRNRYNELLKDLRERRLIEVDGPHVTPVEVGP